MCACVLRQATAFLGVVYPSILNPAACLMFCRTEHAREPFCPMFCWAARGTDVLFCSVLLFRGTEQNKPSPSEMVGKATPHGVWE